mgnify:CR=1 FL=1
MSKETQQITKKDIEHLLSNQTIVILDAVNEKIERLDKKIDRLDIKFSQKIDILTTTLDKFLKRMTDMEDEFTMMKHDLNRMKKVIKEKLGVDLT